jgi:hypothetical protein
MYGQEIAPELAQVVALTDTFVVFMGKESRRLSTVRYYRTDAEKLGEERFVMTLATGSSYASATAEEAEAVMAYDRAVSESIRRGR